MGVLNAKTPFTVYPQFRMAKQSLFYLQIASYYTFHLKRATKPSSLLRGGGAFTDLS